MNDVYLTWELCDIVVGVIYFGLDELKCEDKILEFVKSIRLYL